MYKKLLILAIVSSVLLWPDSTPKERHFHLADMHVAQVRSVPMPLLVRAAHLTQPTMSGTTALGATTTTRWPEPTTREPSVVPASTSGLSRASVGTSSGGAPYTGDWGKWGPILQCESNGNWQANTGNGYYGGLQFSLRSWQWVGGSGYPHEATPQEQILRAEKLLALQGWGAWLACSKKVGYR